jgi:phytoene/squalene synthetase
VLHVFGAATPNRVLLSDRVCAGLQIVEHLQDIAEDFSRGRVYLPREDLERFGCDDQDLAGPPSAGLRALIDLEANRARALLGSGAPLARTLPPAPRLAVAGFTAGGLRALDRLQLGRATRLGYIWQMLRAAAGR